MTNNKRDKIKRCPKDKTIIGCYRFLNKYCYADEYNPKKVNIKYKCPSRGYSIRRFAYE